MFTSNCSILLVMDPKGSEGKEEDENGDDTEMGVYLITGEDEEEEEDEGSLLCARCNKIFEDKDRLKLHYSKYHKQEQWKDSEVVKRPKRKYNRHLCDICNKHFADRWTFQHHKKTVHLSVREHECQLCPKAFLSRKDAQRHYRGVHLGQKILYPGRLTRVRGGTKKPSGKKVERNEGGTDTGRQSFRENHTANDDTLYYYGGKPSTAGNESLKSTRLERVIERSIRGEGYERSIRGEGYGRSREDRGGQSYRRGEERFIQSDKSGEERLIQRDRSGGKRFGHSEGSGGKRFIESGGSGDNELLENRGFIGRDEITVESVTGGEARSDSEEGSRERDVRPHPAIMPNNDVNSPAQMPRTNLKLSSVSSSSQSSGITVQPSRGPVTDRAEIKIFNITPQKMSPVVSDSPRSKDDNLEPTKVQRPCPVLLKYSRRPKTELKPTQDVTQTLPQSSHLGAQNKPEETPIFQLENLENLQLVVPDGSAEAQIVIPEQGIRLKIPGKTQDEEFFSCSRLEEIEPNRLGDGNSFYTIVTDSGKSAATSPLPAVDVRHSQLVYDRLNSSNQANIGLRNSTGLTGLSLIKTSNSIISSNSIITSSSSGISNNSSSIDNMISSSSSIVNMISSSSGISNSSSMMGNMISSSSGISNSSSMISNIISSSIRSSTKTHICSIDNGTLSGNNICSIQASLSDTVGTHKLTESTTTRLMARYDETSREEAEPPLEIDLSLSRQCPACRLLFITQEYLQRHQEGGCHGRLSEESLASRRQTLPTPDTHTEVRLVTARAGNGRPTGQTTVSRLTTVNPKQAGGFILQQDAPVVGGGTSGLHQHRNGGTISLSMISSGDRQQPPCGGFSQPSGHHVSRTRGVSIAAGRGGNVQNTCTRVEREESPPNVSSSSSSSTTVNIELVPESFDLDGFYSDRGAGLSDPAILPLTDAAILTHPLCSTWPDDLVAERINDVTDRINDVTDRIADVTDCINDVTDCIDDATDPMDVVTDRIGNVTNSINNVTGLNNDVTNGVDDVANELHLPEDQQLEQLELSNRPVDLNPRLGALNRRLNDLNPHPGDLNPQLGDINQRPGDLNPRIDDLKPRPGDLNPRLVDLNPRPSPPPRENPRNRCETCDLEFKTKALLTKHCKAVHNLRLKLSCPSCPLTFSSPQSLTLHRNSVHEGIRSVCNYCLKPVLNLTHHIRMQHKRGNERSHPCTVCSFRFRTQFQLDRHVAAVHQQLRPHPCPGCSQSFKAKRDMERHYQRLHNKQPNITQRKSGRSQYACPVCKIQFKMRKLYDAHKISVHGNLSEEEIINFLNAELEAKYRDQQDQSQDMDNPAT